jgi:hypothetical protein
VTGSDRSGEISSVVTFGTPETGSVAALLLASGIKLASADSDLLAVLHFILSYCGQQASTDVETGGLCQTLPAPARAFASTAGVALRFGSRQLAALKLWPRDIKVAALAGNITLNLRDPGWFSLPWDTTAVDIGDGIVTRGSALSGATSSGNDTCQLQLNPLRGAADKLLVTVGWESKSQVAQFPLSKFAGNCFHTSLMRLLELANDADAAVIADIQSRQPLSPAPPARGRGANIYRFGVP